MPLQGMHVSCRKALRPDKPKGNSNDDDDYDDNKRYNFTHWTLSLTFWYMSLRSTFMHIVFMKVE